MTSNNDNQSIVMLASYQVEPERLGEFVEILKDTEALYRSHETITSAPIIRLRSIENPEFIVELIEWRSPKHLNEVMENDEIMAKWSLIKSQWKDGDFGFSSIPEASIPWALMKPIQ